MAHAAHIPIDSDASVIVKNTFIDIKEPADESRRERRTKTLPSRLPRPPSEDALSDVSTEAPHMSHLVGRVWRLSQDPQGCREVQAALDDARLDDHDRETLMLEVRGHVMEAMMCPHANHVLQKCAVTLRPIALQFIIDEIPSDRVSMVAQDKFGCRVLQRLFERCDPSQVRWLVEGVLSDVCAIGQSAYGNYVLQNLLEHGTDMEQRYRLQGAINSRIVDFGASPFGCIVISAILSRCPQESRLATAHAVLDVRGLLASMACTRHGHRTVFLLLSILEASDYERARSQLRVAMPSLLANKFGRLVAAQLR